MTHVSAKTAIKLKDTGFPQPAPAEGQVWYFYSGLSKGWEPFVILGKDRDQWRMAMFGPFALRLLWWDGGVFAPTLKDFVPFSAEIKAAEWIARASPF